MADDIIASAKSMTSVSELQHVTVGMPANAITPATLTAMVGLSKGGALQMVPSITQALDKIQSHTEGMISGIAPGISSALANAGISTSGISTSADPAATVAAIKAAAAVDGIMVDTATENSLTGAITAGSMLSGQASKIMAAGPVGFGKILNQVTAHVNDAVELKTAANFMANTSFGDFGSGIKDMASLTTQGLNNVLGNFKAVGSAFAAAGPMFDLTDMKNFGSPLGMINKLSSLKLGNSSGIKDALVKVGADVNNLGDPTQADKISKAFSSIKDPKVIATVSDQFGVLAKKNPFAGLPSAGSDNTLSGGASLLGGS